MKKVIRWIVPVLFLAGGILIYLFLSGCRFLAMVTCGIAPILCVYNLLSIWESRNRIGAKVLRTILSVCLVFLVILACVTAGFILYGGDTATAQDYEYLIVLGAGLNGNAPSEILQDRINHAYTYLTAHPDTICIASGGMGSDEQISEALCIYNELTAMGIDPERIWLEDHSTSTVENFRYSLILLQETTGSAPERIGVISNEFHLFRVGLIAQSHGLDADLIPAPTSNILIRISYTLREIVALWKYLLIGG